MKLNSSIKSTHFQNKDYLLNFFRRFLPLFILSAILPLLLSYTFYYSKAERNNEVRIWFEPSILHLKPNQSYQLDIMAAFLDETRLVPSITAQIEPNPQISVNQSEFNYYQPFRGKIRLGKVTVTGTSVGTYYLNIPETNINTSLQDISVLTSHATIIINN